MNGQTIELRDSQDHAFKAYVSPPKGRRGPGVVFGLDIHGLRPLYHEIADLFADHGCLAVVPDYFWDAQRGADGSYLATYKFPTCIEVIRSTMAAVRLMAVCNGRVAVVGYSLGGNLAFLGVSRLGAEASVSYYGTRIHTFLDDVHLVAKPFILHIAEHDRTYPDEQRDRILAAVRSNANISPHVYAAPHGFASSTFQQDAAEIANARTFELLDSLKEAPGN